MVYFHSGDRAYSGLYRVYGEHGQLVVELFDPEKGLAIAALPHLSQTYRWHNERLKHLVSTNRNTQGTVAISGDSIWNAHVDLRWAPALQSKITPDRNLLRKT